MRRVIFNLKGGVGKSTITCNLAAISAFRGKKTLVVDLDPQSNSTQYLLGRDAHAIRPTVTEFFKQVLNLSFNITESNTFIHPTIFKNLFILPASLELASLLNDLENRDKLFKLRTLLDNVGPFDNIFIDTPPALNFFTKSALIASNTCLIPFDCDLFSRNAIYHLLTGMNEMRTHYHPTLHIEGVIVNQYLPGERLPKKLVNEMAMEGLPIIEPYLSSHMIIRESHDAASPLIHFAKEHAVTQQYESIMNFLDNISPQTLKRYGVNQTSMA